MRRDTPLVKLQREVKLRRIGNTDYGSPDRWWDDCEEQLADCLKKIKYPGDDVEVRVSIMPGGTMEVSFHSDDLVVRIMSGYYTHADVSIARGASVVEFDWLPNDPAPQALKEALEEM